MSPRFKEIKAALVAAGWRVYMEPQLPGILDDEWIFRLKANRLDFLFVSETGEWSRKLFGREPFGDYTICYHPLGAGERFENLLETARNWREEKENRR